MLNRRSLLHLATAAAASGLLPGTIATADAARLGAQLTHPDLLALLGARCAALLPRDTAALTELAGISAAHGDTLLDAFAARRAADFRAGRVHSIDGWLMAEAECALCVLVAQG